MSGHNCISLPPMQSGPGVFFGFRCLISNPTSSLHIGSKKKEFISLVGKYSSYLSPQSGKSDFKTSPIVQKWLIMASDILLLSLMTFPSTNNLFIEVDLDPALGFVMCETSATCVPSCTHNSNCAKRLAANNYTACRSMNITVDRGLCELHSPDDYISIEPVVRVMGFGREGIRNL